MPPNATAKKSGNTTSKNVRNANPKKTGTTAMEDIDPIVHPSQSSSDDGMMATIAQQMQVSMEKKKKEKEVKFLQTAQVELTRNLSEKAHDFADGVAEMDKIFSDFQDAYAANEDHIRKLWDAILKEQLRLQVLIEEKQTAVVEREKRREEEHIQALTHGRKACEEFQRLIDSLDPHSESTHA
ncbi:hypothetical protein DFH11DRAFT_1688705 [Phellopilus nigrolimitatus]|nr:hypothetical protein DFH11DRAFT_1688705 [Phellopilus nigrolimitatus]